MVMQAEAWGFETRPWMRWLQENKWVAEYVVDSSRAADALKALAKFLGSDYDWLSAAWVGLKRWLARWRARPMSSPTKLMCSEAQLRYLQFVGVELGSLNVETTSPMEAMSFVGALGWESLESPLREPE
jgi:hypothetical protein